VSKQSVNPSPPLAIVHALVVAAPLPDAFERFTNGMRHWWDPNASGKPCPSNVDKVEDMQSPTNLDALARVARRIADAAGLPEAHVVLTPISDGQVTAMVSSCRFIGSLNEALAWALSTAEVASQQWLDTVSDFEPTVPGA